MPGREASHGDEEFQMQGPVDAWGRLRVPWGCIPGEKVLERQISTRWRGLHTPGKEIVH